MTTAVCSVELLNLELPARIGTYGPDDVVPESHTLDLTLSIASDWVLIATDDMANVFDYDPLVAEIERLAREEHYQTQERLITKIALACVRCDQVQGLDMRLTNKPVLAKSGSLGVRLVMDADSVVALREGRMWRA